MRHACKWQPVEGFYSVKIEDSLHFLTLKYRDNFFSSLVESEPSILRLDDDFSWKLATKILLVRHPQHNGEIIYQVYDGAHRLSYLSRYGMRVIPRNCVAIGDHASDIKHLMSGDIVNN